MEEWRDILGYEGMYQVSNMGRVRSVDRLDSRNHLHKGKILKLRPKSGGYLQVQLCKQSGHYFYSVHRLVANAFIPNPENKATVNHLDEVKTNNVVSNLEWATHKENTNYGTGIARRIENYDYETASVKRRRTFKEHGRCRRIRQFDSEGNLVAEYESIGDACRVTGYDRSGIIASCRQYGGCRNYKGFKWKYA